MARYRLQYTEVKRKDFNKKHTLQKFIMTKAYQVIDIWEKRKDGIWCKVKQERT